MLKLASWRKASITTTSFKHQLTSEIVCLSVPDRHKEKKKREAEIAKKSTIEETQNVEVQFAGFVTRGGRCGFSGVGQVLPSREERGSVQIQAVSSFYRMINK